MAFKFRPISQPAVKPEPLILVASQAITFKSPEVLESLGNPEFLEVHIDSENKALRLQPVTEKTNLSTRRVGHNKDKGSSPYINVLMEKSGLPYGYYRPIGGGIFVFDKPKKRKTT